MAGLHPLSVVDTFLCYKVTLHQQESFSPEGGHLDRVRRKQGGQLDLFSRVWTLTGTRGRVASVVPLRWLALAHTPVVQEFRPLHFAPLSSPANHPPSQLLTQRSVDRVTGRAVSLFKACNRLLETWGTIL